MFNCYYMRISIIWLPNSSIMQPSCFSLYIMVLYTALSNLPRSAVIMSQPLRILWISRRHTIVYPIMDCLWIFFARLQSLLVMILYKILFTGLFVMVMPVILYSSLNDILIFRPPAFLIPGL